MSLLAQMVLGGSSWEAASICCFVNTSTPQTWGQSRSMLQTTCLGTSELQFRRASKPCMAWPWVMAPSGPTAPHAATHSQAAVSSAAQSSKLQSRQSTFVPGAAAGLTPTLQRRRTRASLRACNWDPLPSAPLVLLDGPYAAPAMRWEVRQQCCPVTAWRRCSQQPLAPAAGTLHVLACTRLDSPLGHLQLRPCARSSHVLAL